MVKEIAELTYDERLVWLGLPSMKYRRLRGDMITVFNIFQRGDQNTFFKFNLDTGTRGHSLKIFKSHSKSNREKFSFSNRIITTWNMLTEQIVKAKNVNQFKNLLDLKLVNLKYKYD